MTGARAQCQCARAVFYFISLFDGRLKLVGGDDLQGCKRLEKSPSHIKSVFVTCRNWATKAMLKEAEASIGCQPVVDV
jgi:hypothetical protein